MYMGNLKLFNNLEKSPYVLNSPHTKPKLNKTKN